jgi:hypothetical protein
MEKTEKPGMATSTIDEPRGAQECQSRNTTDNKNKNKPRGRYDRYQQQPTGIPGVTTRSQEWETIRRQAPCKPIPTAIGLCTQTNSVGKSGGKPHDKLLVGQWPVTTFTCNLKSTRNNNQPQPSNNLIESSHTKQGHRMPAGVCWKKLIQGAGVLAS